MALEERIQILPASQDKKFSNVINQAIHCCIQVIRVCHECTTEALNDLTSVFGYIDIKFTFSQVSHLSRDLIDSTAEVARNKQDDNNNSGKAFKMIEKYFVYIIKIKPLPTIQFYPFKWLCFFFCMI